jgi:asparagine synthase (glutamine-hydrolysing)
MALAGILGDEDAVRAMRRLAAMAAPWQQPGVEPLLCKGVVVALASQAGVCASTCGRFTLVRDGEIHNEDELRAEVARAGAPPQDDIVLAALLALGERALPLLNGAWALALLDRAAGSLLLARDHLGIRPLYVHARGGVLFFASEIKAILAGSEAAFAVAAVPAARFLEQALLDAQRSTFFAGIEALPAGHSARILLDGAPRLAAPTPYWRLPERDDFAGTDAERVAAVHDLLVDSVQRRLRGQPAPGALVSGGVDSSAVAAIAVAACPATTLIAGVSRDERQRDPLLDAMCAHLRRSAQRIPLGIDAQAALPELAAVIQRNDEPVRSFVTVTEHRLKQAARGLGLEAVVSGLGADEVFAGNLVHMVLWVQSLLRSGRWLRALRAISGIAWHGTIRPRWRRRVQKRYFRCLDGERQSVRGPALAAVEWRCDLGLGPRTAHARLLADLTQLALPALLHGDDRSSRAFGLQTRLPYLDYRLVRLVAPMAPELKLRQGFTKWLLRRAMAERLPAAVAWRKVKQGGPDAYGEWLKKDLHGPIVALLGGELASAALGLVDADAVRARYRAYCAQRPDAGLISAQDVFNPLAIELWARGHGSRLRRP